MCVGPTCVNSKKNWRMKYLVAWKGLPMLEASREKEATLWQFKYKIQEYLRSVLMRASSSSSGGGLLAP